MIVVYSFIYFNSLSSVDSFVALPCTVNIDDNPAQTEDLTHQNFLITVIKVALDKYYHLSFFL